MGKKERHWMMQRSQVVSTGISRQSVLLIKGGQEHEEENIKSDDRTRYWYLD